MKDDYNDTWAVQEAFLSDEIWDSVYPKHTSLPEELEHIERNRIAHVMETLEGNKTHAAKELGIGRTNLIHKLKKYKLNF